MSAQRVCSGLLLAVLAPAWVVAQPAVDRAIAERVQQLTSRDSRNLVTEQLPDGTTQLRAKDRFRHVHLGRLDPDGHIEAVCVGSEAEASRFFGRDLRTGAPLAAIKAAHAEPLDTVAARHGLSTTEYAHYWNLIEQAKAEAEELRSVSLTISNNDGVGEGFNDPTVVAPEGGNNGVTRGQQRLNVFNQAAGIWGAFLDSNVPIVVGAQFNSFPGQCGPGGGVLGFAGPNNFQTNFPNALRANTFYPIALANKMRRADGDVGNADISSEFNSDVDTGCLGAGTRFYYGLDNATPAGRINLLITVLHELGHGLGSLSLIDETTGVLPSGMPDIWAHFMFDLDVNLLWTQMTNAQRVASAINTDDLVFNGPSTRIASAFLSAGRETDGSVQLFTPNPVQSGSSVSHWNTAALPNLLMEPSINVGLPLTLDLTRQQMRDIGWFRDTNTADTVRDAISNVTPNSGTVNVGSNVNITWTNVGGFADNVSIELSTNGGTTFTTVIATNVPNTGSFSWNVPNLPTTQARVRVHQHDFADPLAMSSANFTIAANLGQIFANGFENP